MFELKSTYKPTGDQPVAIEKLTEALLSGHKHQVLLGTTGSGKTFTVANVIQNTQKTTLILAHNKTLAAQLYQEFRDFFPNNAVEYFVSYYDYYQPESYVPHTDTYIEKDADINEEIDKLRLSATNALLTREDVIVVASVSCIYNIGSPKEYQNVSLELKVGMKARFTDIQKRLTQLYYERSEMDFKRGTFRVRGEFIDVHPSYMDIAIRLQIVDDLLKNIQYFDPVSGDLIDKASMSEERRGSFVKRYSQDEKEYADHRAKEGNFAIIFPAKHYVTNEDRREKAILAIEKDLEARLTELREQRKDIEAYRLEQRTKYDIEMIREIGYCKGIENYSWYFDERDLGASPYTLLDFFPKDFLLVVDESHISIPQVRGMFNGDRARKSTLVDYGFRLPTALENRPLRFEEFLRKINQVLYTSATPNEWEIAISEGVVVEQLIRPTGLIDPKIVVLPTKGQISDLEQRIRERVARKERVLVTTLTKRMAEELSNFLIEKGLRVTYLHADIETLERTDILDSLRKGEYDVLVGINLLREGLDLPEVSLVAILDADKEGFLRSETSLIQTMGRAARHLNGEVVMYADVVTGSMERAIKEVDRRREIQSKYNQDHGIVPTQISKPIREKLIDPVEETSESTRSSKVQVDVDYSFMSPPEIKRRVKALEKMMKLEADMLNFEEAAKIRDEIKKIKKFLQ